MSSRVKQFTVGIEMIDDPAWMGGTLYLQNLAVCLSRLPAQERPGVKLLGPLPVIDSFLNKWPEVRTALDVARSPLQTLLGRLGLKTRRSAVDVIYPGFGAQVPGAQVMRWIPDFQHRYLGQLFSQAEIDARDASIQAIAAKRGVVVFSSQAAADDFALFYPEHIATPKIWHFYSLLNLPVANAENDPRKKFRLPQKYLYLPNQFWVHKNHIVVLKALATLKREHGLIIPLVCTGAQNDRRNEKHFASLLEFIRGSGLTDSVHFLGLLERADQIEVLRYAAAVVQPSLFEGWSTVVEDVRAIGRPMFLSDLKVHREQAPAKTRYFNPHIEDDLITALLDSWSELSPGLDGDAEKLAQDGIQARLEESARQFCSIARVALEIAS